MLLSKFPSTGNSEVYPRDLSFVEATLQHFKVMIGMVADYTLGSGNGSYVLNNLLEGLKVESDIVIPWVSSRKSFID